MYEEDRHLAEECERLARETGAAVDWLETNRTLVGRAREGHEKELRKAARLFRGCAVAARRKMCVGVFGPSQAGKSYLVSTLAGDDNGALLTRLGGAEHDFLSEINPAGGKESTGLVTRFTLTGGEAAKKAPVEPDAFPVHVRLLSPVDLVKILANTYFSDAEHMDSPNRDALLASLAALEAKKRGAPTGGMTEDDVEDLQEYVVKYFRGKARVQQLLDRHFWNRVIPLAPLLEDADRAELFSLIWDGVAPFTRLLASLFSALRALDFAPEAFLPINALVPRERSIIDVATLGSLTPENDDELDVVASGVATGTVRARIARVYATALTAELVIPMSGKPADFFNHTDLLDFPGYRSRKIFVDLARETEEPAKLKECFLRGKVAYLFERYCAERELTGLLLCIGSGPQEVQGLGGAVNEWITGTHGATPDKREGKEKSLFFILTKSDLEFEDKAGARDVSERWETRMFASMEVFSSHEWLKKWDTQGPFDNFFLMRNPTVRLYLFNHDANGRETALKEEMLPWVAEFERAFMASPAVGAHFADKEASWRAFMTPNDGGLSLIRERLAPICKPELKRRQILTTLEEQLARIADRLRPYWRTDDREEQRKQQAALAQNLARVVLGMIRPRRFGAFSRLLTVRDQDIYDLYFQSQYRMHEELAALPPGEDKAGNGPAAPSGSVDDLLADILGSDVLEPATAAPAQTGAPGQKDEASAFGAQIEQYWLAGLRAQAEDPVLQQFFTFDAGLFSQFVHELGVGFVRLGVREELEDALRKAARYANVEKERLLWKQAGLAAGVINRYTDWLGFDPRRKSEQERTVSFGARQRTLFTPPPESPGLPELAEDPGDYADSAAMDWSAALIHLIRENGNFDGDRDFDPVQNSRLKEIIESFSVRAS